MDLESKIAEAKKLIRFTSCDVARIREMLEEDPDLLEFRFNVAGWTLLHHAASVNQVEAVRLLLSLGADVCAISQSRGLNALHINVRANTNDSRVAEALLEACKHPNCPDKENSLLRRLLFQTDNDLGYTPLMTAVEMIEREPGKDPATYSTVQVLRSYEALFR